MSPNKAKGTKKPYWEMNAAELRAATRAFDDPAHQPPALPPTAADVAQQRRARTKSGRPRKGMGAKAISLTVERALLARSDAYAKELGISRAELVQRGLNAILPSRTVPTPRGRRRQKAPPQVLIDRVVAVQAPAEFSEWVAADPEGPEVQAFLQETLAEADRLNGRAHHTSRRTGNRKRGRKG